MNHTDIGYTDPTNVPLRFELLAVDLDGTVLDEAFQISERVRRALRVAISRGVRVTIATGRPVPVTRPFVNALSVNAPVLTMQGGLIYDFATEMILHRVTLPLNLACALTGLERDYPAWQVVVYLGDRICLSSLRYEPAFYEALLGTNIAVEPNLCRAIGGNETDKVLLIVPPEDAPMAMEQMAKIVGDGAIVVQSHARFVEVNPCDANKGAGLARLAADLGIPQERVMAIGDQDNDASMIAWAGLGVAMGNASVASKAVADWVAPSIGEDGAAVAIERFVL